MKKQPTILNLDKMGFQQKTLNKTGKMPPHGSYENRGIYQPTHSNLDDNCQPTEDSEGS